MSRPLPVSAKTIDTASGPWPENLEEDLSCVLYDLCRAPAPAGHEDRLVALVAQHLNGRGLRPRIDRLGQVGVSTGTGGTQSVLVTAHLDQLGLVVSAFDPDGFLRVQRLGGVPERVLPGTRFMVHTQAGELPAVVGVKSHHLTPPEEKYRASPVTELYLDIGASNAGEATASGVRVGDPCTYAFAWSALGGGRVATQSLDDRLGVTALLALIDRLCSRPPPGKVHVAFSTQEEFHVRGTLALSAHYQPDIVINLDVSPATDTPDLRGTSPVRLGGGTVLSRLSFHGRGTLGGLIPHPALVHAVETAATESDRGLQYEAIVGLVTDAAFLPMASPEGIAAVGIGIPVRYTHSPVETAQLSDLSDAVDVLDALVRSAGGIDLTRGHRHVP